MCSADAEGGRDDGPDEVAREEPGGTSLIARLRKEYHNCKGSFNVAGLSSLWLPQALNSRGVPARPGGLSGRELQALALRVAQQLQDFHLKTWVASDYPVSEEEYVHAMLLLEVPDRAAAQLAVPLSASLAKYPNMLQNLQNLFERADVQGSAFLAHQDLARMYKDRHWRLHPTCTDGRPLTDAELEDPQHLASQLLEAMDVDQDSLVSYAEFVAFCVGRRKREVKLHLYDLSRGAGNQMQWVLGDGLNQIWHTGIVAFDREYFFSNDTIFDIPGKTSFGEPSQVRSLGFTFWSQDELHDFIVNDLKPIFHRDTYDVICNNCNHFSDRVALYLTGRPLPEDVRLQADRLMDLVTVRAIRPFLNWLLRDCVVSRDGTARPVEVPHGRWHRITTVEEVVPGTVVAMHPYWGRSTAVLGIVCDSRESEAFGPTFKHGLPALSCGSYSCMPQNGCCQSHTRVVSAANGDLEVWVKYLDVLLHGQRDGLCACKLRTQKVPVSRLSLVTLDGSTFGAHYREALDHLTQQLVTKPGLRSVWALNEKSAMAETLADGAGADSIESHEVPALDPIRLSQAELSPEWRAEVEGQMVEA